VYSDTVSSFIGCSGAQTSAGTMPPHRFKGSASVARTADSPLGDSWATLPAKVEDRVALAGHGNSRLPSFATRSLNNCHPEDRCFFLRCYLDAKDATGGRGHKLVAHRPGCEVRTNAMIAWIIWAGRFGQLARSSASDASAQP
jgi:hypothetical protein